MWGTRPLNILEPKILEEKGAHLILYGDEKNSNFFRLPANFIKVFLKRVFLAQVNY